MNTSITMQAQITEVVRQESKGITQPHATSPSPSPSHTHSSANLALDPQAHLHAGGVAEHKGHHQIVEVPVVKEGEGSTRHPFGSTDPDFQHIICRK